MQDIITIYKNINNGGYMRISNSVFTGILNECGQTQLALYLTIFSHFNYVRKDCYPSYKILMEDLHTTSDKTLKKNLKILEDKGYIIIESGWKGKNNNYYFPKEPLTQYTDEQLEHIAKVKRMKWNPKNIDKLV